MWSRLKRYLGYAWSSPVTLAGLTYAGLFHLAGWYKWHGVKEDGLVWLVKDTSPSWLKNLWKAWAGHAIGNVVVLNVDPVKKSQILQHELVHVRQCMRLGIFQPIIYGIAWLGIKLGCESSDPYYTNPFEIDARRVAGQIVDVEGTLRKIKETKKSS